jgi:hypothetical protein
MAYGLKQISPIDLKPSTAIGVKLPFSADNVFTSVYTTKEQTKFNLINFLLSDPRETPLVLFGAGLRSSLFEQITSDSLDELEMSITSKIESNFPNVVISRLSVSGDPSTLAITINFSYTLSNTNENDSIIIKIENA